MHCNLHQLLITKQGEQANQLILCKNSLRGWFSCLTCLSSILQSGNVKIKFQYDSCIYWKKWVCCQGNRVTQSDIDTVCEPIQSDITKLFPLLVAEKKFTSNHGNCTLSPWCLSALSIQRCRQSKTKMKLFQRLRAPPLWRILTNWYFPALEILSAQCRQHGAQVGGSFKGGSARILVENVSYMLHRELMSQCHVCFLHDFITKSTTNTLKQVYRNKVIMLKMWFNLINHSPISRCV